MGSGVGMLTARPGLTGSGRKGHPGTRGESPPAGPSQQMPHNGPGSAIPSGSQIRSLAYRHTECPIPNGRDDAQVQSSAIHWHYWGAAAQPPRVRRVPRSHGSPYPLTRVSPRTPGLHKLRLRSTETPDQHQALPTLHLSCSHAQDFPVLGKYVLSLGMLSGMGVFGAPAPDGSGKRTAASSVQSSRTRGPHP